MKDQLNLFISDDKLAALVEQLWRDYNDYRLHTAQVYLMHQRGIPLATLKRTDDRIAALREMAVWCLERDMDPRLWLYTLFRSTPSRRWRYAPRWTQLVPKHPEKSAHMREYEAATDRPVYSARIRDEAQASRKTLDPNRDIIPAAEILKRALLDQGGEACLDEIEQTYGHHPHSVVCKNCSLAERCIVLLQSKVTFDIQALRRGELTVRQAREQVWYRS